MKYHRHLISSCSQALESIFFEDRHADKCIEYYLKHNKKWGSRDRRFFAETVYDCVRWWRLYWYILGKEPSQKTLDLVFVSIWMREGHLPEVDEAESVDLKKWESRRKQVSNPAIAESIPDWLHEYCLNDKASRWAEVLPYLNKANHLVLRTNLSQTTREKLLSKLHSDQVEATELLGTSEGVFVEKRVNIFQNEVFKKGWFEVQDGSSQQVAHFLQVEPGLRVIDACAGAGGKTLHIADLMQNKGKIISLDIHSWKLDQLKLRARRNGYSNIEIKVIENQKTIKRLKASADRLLLDVPCTGLGVLRRNPDTKWKLSPLRIEELLDIQKDILEQYSKMLKPGGLMVYATCSILEVENETQVSNFLKAHSNFKLLKQKRIFPTRNGYDGFYMALLKKID